MQWTYQEQLVENLPDKCVGFVYKITNLKDGRIYIGKKKAFFLKTKQVKKKKKRYKEESDWRIYYGSSDELKKDVVVHGEEYFKREILRFCFGLAEASYYEAKYQFEYNVLLNDNYYNKFIMVRLNSNQLKKVKSSE